MSYMIGNASRSRYLWLVLACACTGEAAPQIPIAHDPVPPTAPAIASATNTQAPPPPAPAEPTPQPPPAAVTTFLAARANDTAPWTARAGRRSLSASDAAELARRLGEKASYVDGDYGCVGQPVSYQLARGRERFAFVDDCGHMQLGDNDHAAIFSTEMIEFLRRVR